PDTFVPPQDAGGDAPALGFCAAQGPHTMCDDFDGTPQAWTPITKFGTQGLDGTAFTSGPSSYQAATNTLSSGQIANVEWKRVFGRGPHTMHFEYSLRVDVRDANHDAALANVEVYDSTTNQDFSVDLALGSTGAMLEEWFGSYKSYSASKDIA